MVTVSATKRPRGHQDDDSTGQPELTLRDPEPSRPRPGRGVAARGHQPWATRFNRGQGDIEGSSVAGHGAGWEVFSYLIAGLLAYGGIGWLIGNATHAHILFPIGMLVGIAISLGWIVYKYGRQK